jgi:hypothetical protein
MAFNLEKFIRDIFNPQKGEVVTVMYDVPHGNLVDNRAWEERRKMAKEWHDGLAKLQDKWGIKVNPIVSYEATGSNGAELPARGQMGDKDVELERIISESTILLSMPEFSATAPLYARARKLKRLRVGSMPGVARSMEETSLSADYNVIIRRCKDLAPFFEKAVGAEVEFSSGHKCYFDLSAGNHVHRSDGFLHTEVAGTERSGCNLPTGEVYVVPNEKPDSRTSGELPIMIGNQLAVCTVRNNRIVEVKGDGSEIEELRKGFREDPARSNIAEFAVGCNEKARVTGIVLEDEKALGFHWAYGRSDHLGGAVGIKDFRSPANVVHNDTVYARGTPITCKRLDMILADKTRKTLIKDGALLV